MWFGKAVFIIIDYCKAIAIVIEQLDTSVALRCVKLQQESFEIIILTRHFGLIVWDWSNYFVLKLIF